MQLNIYGLILCAIIFTILLVQAQGRLPNTMILATGGTIAGKRATVGYTTAKVAIDVIIHRTATQTMLDERMKM